MTNDLENPSLGSFSIIDSMEMGVGNQSLLEDLLSPETVTAKTDEIAKIESPDKKKVEKPSPDQKGPKKDEEKGKDKEEAPKQDPNKDLNNLLFEEEDEDEKNGEDAPPDKKEDEVNENRFNALSKDLLKLGVFSKDEGEEDFEINTPEEFLERFNYEKKKGAIEVVDKFIGQFGEEYQEAFDAIFVKGVDPKEYFNTYNSIQGFADLDLTQESNQELVIKQGLIDQGYESDKITAKIEKIKSYGDLEDEARSVHQILIKKEAAKLDQLKKDSETKLQQYAATKSQYIKNVQTVLQDKLKTKEFDGIPLSQQFATEVQDFLVIDKYKTPSGETLTEFDRTILDLKRPENHEKKVKIALLLKLIEKDPTLSTIQRAGITKKTDTLFGELARQTKKTPVKSDKTDKPSWFS